ncbi:MAG TPA: hypothetical protein VEL11_01730 [Candidatus Bathyarchaeia archaeon]|nr:hypothetical protein [Candidatus Bathyarchaeia archaeon]
MFLAEIINKDNSGVFSNVLVDATDWIDIPLPFYTYLTTPSPLVLRQGDNEIIGAQLRTSEGIIPDVVNVMHSGNNSVIKWESNPGGQKRIFNIEPEPFEINIPTNAQIGHYAMPASALSTISASLLWLCPG